VLPPSRISKRCAAPRWPRNCTQSHACQPVRRSRTCSSARAMSCGVRRRGRPPALRGVDGPAVFGVAVAGLAALLRARPGPRGTALPPPASASARISVRFAPRIAATTEAAKVEASSRVRAGRWSVAPGGAKTSLTTREGGAGRIWVSFCHPRDARSADSRETRRFARPERLVKRSSIPNLMRRAARTLELGDGGAEGGAHGEASLAADGRPVTGRQPPG
jgi:hypothetical protein